MSVVKLNTGKKQKGIGGLVFNTLLIGGLGAGAFLGIVTAVEKFTGKQWSFDEFGFVASSTASDIVTSSGTATGVAVQINDNIGDQATLTLNAYDREANSETVVSSMPVGVYRILDAEGSLSKLNDVDSYTTASTVTTASVGQQLAFFGGNSSYYMDPVAVYDVSTVVDTINLDAHKIASESQMSMTVKDEDGNTLTADDDAENTADYSLSLGADEETLISAKLKVGASDVAYQLKAIGVFYENDVDNLEPVSADWVKVTMPDEIKDAVLTHTNDTSTDFTGDYDAVYVYKPNTNEVIDLHEWDSYELPFVLTAGSTDPTANTGDVAGIIALDGAWEEGQDGNMYFDFYKHDTNEKASDVGLDETETSPEGLQIGFTVEVQ